MHYSEDKRVSQSVMGGEYDDFRLASAASILGQKLFEMQIAEKSVEWVSFCRVK